ncbi:hypothetical protein BJX63DRAFT_325255 [Aspergillus granulosus]|uniref:Uncharacterized protein n=1 Tax=Aspergillus granulosus TaxID=176169 RepID=A0ABR4H453_9EURO
MARGTRSRHRPATNSLAWIGPYLPPIGIRTPRLTCDWPDTGRQIDARGIRSLRQLRAVVLSDRSYRVQSLPTGSLATGISWQKSPSHLLAFLIFCAGQTFFFFFLPLTHLTPAPASLTPGFAYTISSLPLTGRTTSSGRFQFLNLS